MLSEGGGSLRASSASNEFALGGVLIALGLLVPAAPLWFRAIISGIGLAIIGVSATALYARDEPVD